MDYYKPNFGLMILVWSCMIYSWEAMAEMLSVMFDNPLIGMMLFMASGSMLSSSEAFYTRRRHDLALKIFTILYHQIYNPVNELY